jgi:hypothetical protein
MQQVPYLKRDNGYIDQGVRTQYQATNQGEVNNMMMRSLAKPREILRGATGAGVCGTAAGVAFAYYTGRGDYLMYGGIGAGIGWIAYNFQ